MPGAELAAAIEAERVGAREVEAPVLVGVAVACRRLRSWAQAVELEAVAALAQARVDEQLLQAQAWAQDPGGQDPEQLGRRCAVEELAAAAGVSANAMWGTLNLAEELARLRPVRQALRDGVVDYPKAKAFCEAVSGLPPAQAAAVVERVLPTAGQRSTARVRQSLRRAVKRIAPRHDPHPDEPGPDGRAVSFHPEPKGMCRLTAYLPADQAMTMKAALDALAALAQTPGDERTRGQRRADALADAVLNALTAGLATSEHAEAATAALLRPQVTLTVPIELLTRPEPDRDPGAEPAEPVLRGYGPISHDMARDLAARGTWRCAATDQHGTLLGLGATGYTPAYRAGRALTRYVDTRDQHCRFPGCRRPAHRADHDHRAPYPTGATCECNLIVLCRAHHRLKHRTGFHPEPSTDPHDPPGTLTWTTPTGTTCKTTPTTIGTPTRTQEPRTQAPRTHPDAPPF